jgi:hypothetical protein
MAVSVESIVTTLGRFPQGIVGIVPTQLPANFLARVGAGVDTACEDAVARFVCDSTTRFVFGLAVCSGPGVGFSSTIGAGRRGDVTNNKNAISKDVCLIGLEPPFESFRMDFRKNHLCT